MSVSRTCPGCGSIAPGAFGRCPACGRWTGSRVLAVRVGRMVAAIVAVLIVVWLVRYGRGKAPAMRVQVTSAGSMLALDARGTDVSALIDNPNRVPVDVLLRVRGYDMFDNLAVEQTIGPFRRVPPGGPYPIQGHLATTPLKFVTFDAVDVRPTKSPER